MTAEGVAMETSAVAVAVSRTHEDTTKLTESDEAPSTVSVAAQEVKKPSSITSFEELSTAGLDAATLLAILEEVRDCIGPSA